MHLNICCGMRYMLVPYQLLSRDMGDATNARRLTADVLRSCCCSQSFILFCLVFFNLMRNGDLSYSPQRIHSSDSLPASQANWVGHCLR